METYRETSYESTVVAPTGSEAAEDNVLQSQDDFKVSKSWASSGIVKGF